MALTTVSPALLDTTAQYYGFKNRIINGDMRIDQRNAGASAIPSGAGTFTLDRWLGTLTQAAKYSAQQNAGAVTPPVGFSNYLGVTSLSAYSILTGDYFGLVQSIEGFNVADLNWGSANAPTVTLSFWVRSSLTGTFGGALRNSAGSRSYPFSYTVSSANNWEQKSITILGDTTGTWLTTNGIGLQVWLSLGAGATFSGTAGAWSGSNLTSATGAVSVVGTSGATFYITGVQLEKGTAATSFDYVDYGRQLAQCQRYYELLGLGGSGGASSNTAGFQMGWKFAVQKRATPTIAHLANYNVTVTGAIVATISATALSFGDTSGVMCGLTSGTASTVGYALQYNQSTPSVAASAEL